MPRKGDVMAWSLFYAKKMKEANDVLKKIEKNIMTAKDDVKKAKEELAVLKNKLQKLEAELEECQG